MYFPAVSLCAGDTVSPRPFQKFGHTIDSLGFCDEAKKKKKERAWETL